jgi:pilus assembly protein FimV
MAKDKKPSIFADRGTIGSPDELDEYGVWVKSEPQDLSVLPEADGFSTQIPDTDDVDSAIPDLEYLPDFDSLGVASQDNGVSLNIPIDDLGLPDLEIDDKTTEEDNDSDVFNFGELAEPVELNSIDLDSGNPDFAEQDSAELNSDEPGSEDDEGFKEISMDEFVGTQNSPDPSGSLESEVSLESEDPFDSAEPIEIDADIESVITEAPVIAAVPVGIETNISSPSKETVKGTQTLDLSTQLLMKIAEELSSIRSELSTLKREFSGLKAAAPQAEGKEKDFLGEEDDEKISLTGDEMNNILNTADFTEETGSDAAMGPSENEGDSDELSLSTADLDVEINLSDSNLENLEGETKLGNSSIIDSGNEDNQISADAETPDDSILDFSSAETDGLNDILESGVEPMTPAPAPEDTNYLTADPLADNNDTGELPPELTEETTDEPLDLSGAVIDEPDLSSEIHDNPLEEPSLEDISISLDMSDLDSPDLGPVELDSSELEPIELETEPELEAAEDDIALPILEDVSQGVDDLLIASESPVVEEADSGVFSEKAEETPKETIEEKIEEIPEEVIEEIEEFLPEPEESAAVIPEPVPATEPPASGDFSGIPANLKTELKTVLSYMDQLLEALPDDKIEEFAKSDYYDTYKKLFKELGLV